MIMRFVLYADANATAAGKVLPDRWPGAGVRTQGLIEGCGRDGSIRGRFGRYGAVRGSRDGSLDRSVCLVDWARFSCPGLLRKTTSDKHGAAAGDPFAALAAGGGVSAQRRRRAGCAAEQSAEAARQLHPAFIRHLQARQDWCEVGGNHAALVRTPLPAGPAALCGGSSNVPPRTACTRPSARLTAISATGLCSDSGSGSTRGKAGSAPHCTVGTVPTTRRTTRR